MGEFAIIVGVENYADDKITSVDFARADAMALSTAMQELGIDASRQTVRIDDQATKATVESDVRRLLQALSADDKAYVYYAGHGFARDNKNYLTCSDTRLADLENTSISLAWLFRLLRESDCDRFAIFLDSCESGLLIDEGVRGIYSTLSDDELTEFFRDAEHCVCFASCKPGQESYSSKNLQHGVWTYHLLQAITGEAPSALVKGKLVTATSLQNHLREEVPKTVRREFTGTRLQSPWLFGAQNGDFLVADVSAIIQQRVAAATRPGADQIKSFSFLGQTVVSIKSLSGFVRRSHTVPDHINSSTKNFVSAIAEREIKDDINRVHAALRQSFSLKNRDVDVSIGDGQGSIITPHFDYEVGVGQDPDDCADALFTRQICNVRDPRAVMSEEFDQAFPRVFDTLEFDLAASIDVEEFVDRMEGLASDSMTIDYDAECEWCTLRVEGAAVEIKVTCDSIRVEADTSIGSVQELVDAYFGARAALQALHPKHLPLNPQEPETSRK